MERERIHILKTEERLTLTKSKSYYNNQVIRLVVGIVVWCIIWIVVFMLVQPSGVEFIFLGLLILLLPAILIPRIYNHIKLGNESETIIFDQSNNHVLNNENLVASIDNIEYLQVFAHIARGPYEFSLLAVLKNGQKIQIDRTVSAEEIYSLAEEIAKFLGVKILNKDKFTPDDQMQEHIFVGSPEYDTDLLTLEEVKIKIKQQPTSNSPLKIMVLVGSVVGVVFYIFHWFGRTKRQF